MKILLVEDQPDKKEAIKKFVLLKLSKECEIVEKGSLRGALKEVYDDNNYDLVLLDMSMPNFDSENDGYDDNIPESFAGKQMLEQMELRNIKIPVIVITQYSSFEGGAVSLDELSNNFASKYSDFYLGSIYFNSGEDEKWQTKFLDLWNQYYEK